MTGNQKNWLCEGTKGAGLVNVGELTTNPPYKTAGVQIKKAQCTDSPGALLNNVDKCPLKVPAAGEGALTQPCQEAGQVFGSKRDCEIPLLVAKAACTPGSRTRLRCTVSCEPGKTCGPHVVRVCEASLALNGGTACKFRDALANTVLQGLDAKPQFVGHFKCPARRDDVELGGSIAVYAGPVLNGIDPAMQITCEIDN